MGLCLSLQMVEQENLCELRRQHTYQKKKELDKLRLKEANMKEKVNTTAVVRKNKPCFQARPRRLCVHYPQCDWPRCFKKESILIYLYVIPEEYFCPFLIKCYGAITFSSSGIWWEEWSLACFKNKLHMMGQNTIKIIFQKCTQNHPKCIQNHM